MLTVCPPEKKKKMERNKRTNATRVAEEQNPHYSLTVEVKKEDKHRLESLRSRVDRAKSLLGIDRKTSSTQNADLLEQLLSCFELVMHSAGNIGSSPVASQFSSPREVRPPPPSFVEHENQQPSRRPQKRQIYVDATVDDPFFVCTGESLKSLVKYFTKNSQCEFCSGEFQLFRLTLSQQGHVCRMELPCVCNDSVVWLSSGLLGHPAKYVANVR